jgi:hypothetical protein
MKISPQLNQSLGKDGRDRQAEVRTYETEQLKESSRKPECQIFLHENDRIWHENNPVPTVDRFAIRSLWPCYLEQQRPAASGTRDDPITEVPKSP